MSPWGYIWAGLGAGLVGGVLIALGVFEADGAKGFLFGSLALVATVAGGILFPIGVIAAGVRLGNDGGG